MKAASLFCLLIVSVFLNAQKFQLEPNGIPVSIGGKNLQNPWNGGYNLLSISMPDIDNDGDNDLLFVASPEGKLIWYRNDGGGADGIFTQADEYLSQINFGNGNFWIACEDIDFDKDFDLFVGNNSGTIQFYENTGSPQVPSFMLKTNAFQNIDGGFTSSPHFNDLNADGLNDMIVGTYQDGYLWYERKDSITFEFEFKDTLRLQTGEAIIPNNLIYTLFLTDIDHDNDLDLFTGSSDPRLSFYRNTGSPSSPNFQLVEENYITTDRNVDFMHAVFVDIDKDSDFDLFFGSNFGSITYFKNNGSRENPLLELENIQLALDFMDFGFYATPTLIDLDEDGDEDLLISPDKGGLFYYFENTGTPTMPSFTFKTDTFVNNWLDFGSYPSWVDIDGDKDLDLVGGSSSREVYLYKNSGTSKFAKFDENEIMLDMEGDRIMALRPRFADLDNDGDFDLYYVARNGDLPDVIKKYANAGTATNYKFTSTNDTLRDDAGQLIGAYDMFIQFIDFDRDNDQDLMVGGSDGKMLYYENVGTKSAPVFHLTGNNFIPSTGSGNDRAIPFLTDIDNDSDLDLFIGRFQGGIFFYRNLEFPIVSDVDQKDQGPFQLMQNHPNPFSSTTSITFNLLKSTNTKIVIYDIAGRLIATPLNQKLSPGAHTVVLDDLNLQPGYYLYSLITSQGQSTKKMLLIKE